MSQVERNKTGREYWRSLEELADSRDFRGFAEREFGDGASELDEGSRRTFLKLIGATLAFAGIGATSCRMPEEHIAPYAHRPEGTTPGSPRYFATSFEYAGVARGLLAKSFDGRPIKLEGNPSHPMNRSVPQQFEATKPNEIDPSVSSKFGAISAIEQASLLELYDPDRSKRVMRREGGKRRKDTLDAAIGFIRERLRKAKGMGGAGLYVLSEATSSPSVLALKKKLIENYPEARWHEYEPVNLDNERAANVISFGKPYRQHLMLKRANVILSLGADFLYSHPSSLRYAQDFAARRDPDGEMSRLYVIESGYSVTGANADYRLAVDAHEVTAGAAALALRLLELGCKIYVGDQFIPKLKAVAGRFIDHPFIEQVAQDLNRERALTAVIAGAEEPVAAHVLVNAINDGIYNTGEVVFVTEAPDMDRVPYLDSITTLAADMQAGKALTLLIIGGNPVYNAPADLDFAAALANVEASVHLSLYDNETSQASTWHIPRAHYLESWGDARAYIGTYTMQQPLIDPLYGGITPAELLERMVSAEPLDGLGIVKRTFFELHVNLEGQKSFDQLLAEGVNPYSFYRPLKPSLTGNSWVRELDRAPRALKEGAYIVFNPCAKLYDGRFANNGWLQELPHPMTKLTWGNVATISPKFAREKKLRTGDVIAIEADSRSIEIPVMIMPGQGENTITLTLGYGRTAAGRVGDGIGVDTYKIRTTKAMHLLQTATLTHTGRRAKLSLTQDHFAIDLEKLGRGETQRRIPALVREATLDHYKEHPDFAEHVVHHPPLESMWNEHEYEGRKWGMTIDLNACIGCGACIVACQAENNIPVVGAKEVRRGREMQWIRVDRYFKGDADAPQAVFQPVTCHHCENAPCEQVCPVAATTHSDDGLNVMVYNRCIGTRYCSDNCPYKVRRFNFFNNHKHMKEVEKMAMNPDVTVRSRGVMEKCTFCIQRIKEVTIPAKNEGREILDGEIVPACAQACPTKAIVFGDLNDASSGVAKKQGEKRAYGMLAELNVKPRLKYLAKVRNAADARGDAGSAEGDAHDAASGAMDAPDAAGAQGGGAGE